MLHNASHAKTPLIWVFSALLLFTPTLVSAMWIDGPTPVYANESGTFYAAISVHGASEGSDISTITLTGTANCFEVKSTDHECLLHIAQGEFHTEGFNMWLVDGEEPASVVFTVLECSGLTIDYAVQVYPHDYVATQSVTWDGIKSLYR